MNETSLSVPTVCSEGPRASSGGRGLALIVDDDRAIRSLLSAMLVKEGFAVMEATNGREALHRFAQKRPDIVFMDLIMPEMDGLEATQRIKELAGTDFIPIIFLTANQDECTLMRCIEAGGDDFLGKPFSFIRLRARIMAIERIRDLQRTVTAKQRLLEELIARDQEEQRLAERIWSQAIKAQSPKIPAISVVERPASLFNGDLLLMGYLPDGGVRILLADFTGHGLAATIAALPVADIFHAMTAKGLGDTVLLAELNRKLHRLLPADRFMAACLVTLTASGEYLTWWNGGMPMAYLRTRERLHELPSQHLPLGILPEIPNLQVKHLDCRPDDRLLLMTDGLTEAADRQGRLFIDGAFGEVLACWQAGTPILPALMAAFEAHCNGIEQADDLALIEVPLDPIALNPGLNRR
ncbi:fused response regulator/phosphatase [Caldichromatium japonicum]|uniref:Fused response regulator/phosphatase n=1 Tax=Caldichromatium japonicum TaxID=2699430 RepID=A0A6G7VCV7_9GAMM|nr:SpoIIE family protein phosphatase [Caldichromatium japonicum]QIK37889.1 fused response regulator/phosphatase [Caldichromatium japonicum]